MENDLETSETRSWETSSVSAAVTQGRKGSEKKENHSDPSGDHHEEQMGLGD